VWQVWALFQSEPDTGGRVLQAFTEGIHYYKTHPEDGIAARKREEGPKG
jgi:hypothetical protein